MNLHGLSAEFMGPLRLGTKPAEIPYHDRVTGMSQKMACIRAMILILNRNQFLTISILVGGWATPLKNMNVNWDDNRNPILMGK